MMVPFIRPLFRIARAHIWPAWTGSDTTFPGPAEGASDDHVRRQDRLAGPGGGHFESDGYDPRYDGAHREASAWAGKGAEAFGLAGPPKARFRAGAGSGARSWTPASRTAPAAT